MGPGQDGDQAGNRDGIDLITANRTQEQLSRLADLTDELRVRKARAHLLDYCRYVQPSFETPQHLRRIGDALERIETGDCKRLMVVVPPRHGKSLLVSQRFPAWALGRNPTWEVILGSYGANLAAAFGRRLRNLTASDEHRRVFWEPGCQLAEDSKAADEWETAAGGVFRAAGVGGAITGRGADLLILDDPVKSIADAESELQRARVWEWYVTDALTRLHPGGRIVLVQTRWHEDDLAGRLLETDEEWEVIHFPAVTGDPPQSLWPERYPVDELLERRSRMPVRRWLALYQGSPTAEEGAYFRREWLREYDPGELAKRWQKGGREYLRVYGASDYAVTEGAGDYTVHVVVGVDPAGHIHVLDVWRAQTEPAQWIDAMLDRMWKYKPVLWAEEAGQIAKGIGPFLSERQRRRQVPGRRESFHSSHDKPTRARSIQARAELDGLYLPANMAWSHELMAELLAFPGGRYDDQVDALSLIGRLLDQVAVGVQEPVRKKRAVGLAGLTFADALKTRPVDDIW